MSHVRTFVVATVAGVALALSPQAADAQQAITTDFEGGIAVPSGDLADAVAVGPAFTVGINFQVHDRISIRAEGGADLYAEEDIADPTTGGTRTGPELTHTRLDVGVLFHALRPGMGGGFWADLDLAGGFHILTTNNYGIPFPSDFESIDISEGYLGAKGGATLGYRLHDSFSAFVGADAYLTPGDAGDLEPFSELAEVEENPETHWSFPIQAGVRFHFQP